MPCSLKPQSNPVAFGSSGLLAVNSNWFNRTVFGLSVNSWPKLFFGPLGLPVIPASICADRWMPSIHKPGGGASAAAGAAGAASVAPEGAAAGAAAGGGGGGGGAGVCAEAVANPLAIVAAAAMQTVGQSLVVVIITFPF